VSAGGASARGEPRRMGSHLNRHLAWGAGVLAIGFGAFMPHPVTGAGAEAASQRVVDRIFTDPSSAIAVQAGQLFMIALDANPSTGYHWAAGPDPDPAVAVLRGTAFLPASSGLIGAPGREIRVYEATGPGTATIALAYLPPGRGGKAAKQMAFTLTVTPTDVR
jgi:predicted secreted protein